MLFKLSSGTGSPITSSWSPQTVGSCDAPSTGSGTSSTLPPPTCTGTTGPASSASLQLSGSFTGLTAATDTSAPTTIIPPTTFSTATSPSRTSAPPPPPKTTVPPPPPSSTAPPPPPPPDCEELKVHRVDQPLPNSPLSGCACTPSSQANVKFAPSTAHINQPGQSGCNTALATALPLYPMGRVSENNNVYVDCLAWYAAGAPDPLPANNICEPRGEQTLSYTAPCVTA
ncbi:hypothetical protein MMC21_006241 [Puttea exsequens]|nr:hypothetical protein [Puttea exsequens]